MAESIQEIRVADDTTEDALVVAKEYEGQLARDGDGGAQLEAAPVPVEVGGFHHWDGMGGGWVGYGGGGRASRADRRTGLW